MPSRKEMVDKFGLLMKQEMQNHNAAILAYNQKSNALEQSMDELDRRHKKEMAVLQESMRELMLQLHKVHTAHAEHCHEQKCLQQNVIKNDEGSRSNLQSLHEQLNHLRAQKDSHQDSLKDLWSEVEHSRYENINRSKEIDLEMQRIRVLIDSQIKLLDKSLRDLPCKSEGAILELRELVAANAFNIKCLYQEMENYKERRFYNEKQIEDLYNKLERLKKKVKS